MLKFHGTFSGVTALALALAEEECHGVLAGPECCEVEEIFETLCWMGWARLGVDVYNSFWRAPFSVRSDARSP